LRLDLFLTAARLIKRRTEAQRKVESGAVRLNGRDTKPAHPVKPGDRLQIRYRRQDVEVEIVKIPQRSVPKQLAAELYRVINQTSREEF